MKGKISDNWECLDCGVIFDCAKEFAEHDCEEKE